MSSSNPIPIILCGQSTQIGHSVIEGLKPEYEVIHFVLTPAMGCASIPPLLSAQTPPSPASSEEENIGTKNYANKPAAIVLGGGYEDASIEEMRAACSEYLGPENTKGIPWLRVDMDIPRPPLGPGYGAHMVSRAKDKLNQINQAGEMGADGVFYY